MATAQTGLRDFSDPGEFPRRRVEKRSASAAAFSVVTSGRHGCRLAGEVGCGRTRGAETLMSVFEEENSSQAGNVFKHLRKLSRIN
jgi:hypothetical protein